MIRSDFATVAAYLFFIEIMMQNTVALAFVATGLNLPVTPLFYLKFLLIFTIVCLLIWTRRLPRFGKIEQMALVIFAVVLLVMLVKGESAVNTAAGLLFYCMPILVFFVGRTLAPFRNDNQMARFLFVLGIIYVVLGGAYYLLGPHVLGDIGLRALLHQRYVDIGRANVPLVDGLPDNLFSLYSGHHIPRAFGVMFDPLENAFFGATLALCLWEVHRRKIIRGAGKLTSAVVLVIALSICRGIIIPMALVWIASKIKKRGIIEMPVWPLALAGVVGVALFVVYLDTIAPLLDPSSGGHLLAYMKLNSAGSLFTLFGRPFENGEPRGEEGLFSTFLFELGIVGLGCFVTWFTMIYRQLKKLADYPFVRPMFEALFVYLVASFTTEMWFAATPGTLFWFLLGNNLAVIEQRSVSTEHMSGKEAAGLERGIGILRP